jgi:hypothetical protein
MTRVSIAEVYAYPCEMPIDASDFALGAFSSLAESCPWLEVILPRIHEGTSNAIAYVHCSWKKVNHFWLRSCWESLQLVLFCSRYYRCLGGVFAARAILNLIGSQWFH